LIAFEARLLPECRDGACVQSGQRTVVSPDGDLRF